MANTSTPEAKERVSETTIPEQGKSEKGKYPLLEISRKVLLAGIGAIALAQDEIEDFVERLVERGEIAEKDGRKLVREIMDRRKQTTHEAQEKMGKQLEEILGRLNVPTKADIEALSEKIADLNKKVEELKK